MSKVNWTVVVIVVFLAMLAVTVGSSLLIGPSYGGWGYGGWGLRGPWMMGGMFFMWLIPVGFVVLTVLGIAWVARTVGGGTNPGNAARVCPSCGRTVQGDWRNCAYCGTALTK